MPKKQKKDDEEVVYKGWKDKHKLLLKKGIEDKTINPNATAATEINPYYNLHKEFKSACLLLNFCKNFKNFCKDYLTSKALQGAQCSKHFSMIILVHITHITHSFLFLLILL